MPIFIYEALDARGRSVNGSVEAPDAQAVVRDLRNIRYTVTSIKEKPDALKFLKTFFQRFERVNLYSLAIFTRQFAVLFNSGISTVRSLDGLSRQTLNGALSRAIRTVHEDVRMGYTLAKAMGKHPGVFDTTYIAMVKAGEMSGAMGEIMERLAALLEREVKLRSKLSAATTYPLVVFFACCLVTFILVSYVFPTFVALFEGLDVQLPLITRSLIWITKFLGNPISLTLLIGSVIAVCYFVNQYRHTERGRRHCDQILLDTYLVGDILKKVALSRFCRTLSTLMSSGVPIIHALEITSQAIGNEVIGDIIMEVQLGLKSGMRLSQPLREYPIFPPMLCQMVAVGEETGSLPTLLERLADFYDLEVEHVLEALTSMFEPLMIGFMGLVVGYVLMAVFIPVYDLISLF
ncbi:MAG: type II secretion system F family protein [bacterium]|nr:type II secretion system F family protein [bacterium]